jgi:hypothetical protein
MRCVVVYDTKESRGVTEKDRQDETTRRNRYLASYACTTGETRVVVEAVLGAIRQPLTYRRSNGGYMRT